MIDFTLDSRKKFCYGPGLPAAQGSWVYSKQTPTEISKKIYLIANLYSCPFYSNLNIFGLTLVRIC